MTGARVRIPIGIWSEIPPDGRWANEGISRVVGFTIEGAARSGAFTFHVLVSRGLASAVRDDLRHLNATEHLDWVVHEPDEAFEQNWARTHKRVEGDFRPAVAMLAAYGNAYVPVDGWINTFPHFTGSQLLKRPVAALLPDAIPYDFPLGWDRKHYWSAEGEWVRWRHIARETLGAARTVVVHSKHVARRHGMRLLGVDEGRIRINPHPPPDLAPWLPFLVDRVKTPESRRAAANILQTYAADKGIAYLRDYPFDEVPFCLVATQDRVTKNVGRAAEAVARMVRERRSGFKLFTTASVHWGADWTLLPGLVEREQMQFDIVSIPDVPRRVHSALFHCAQMTIHPSFYEGIVGSLTFYESVSVGTPCIMGLGPHVLELLETEPELEPLTVDPYDVGALVTLMEQVAAAPDAAFAVQRAPFERRLRRGWDEAAQTYANAALELS